MILGKCLQGRRQDAIIASKFGFREGINTPPYSPEQIDEAITACLEKLQTTYVDLMQVCLYWTMVTLIKFNRLNAGSIISTRLSQYVFAETSVTMLKNC